MVSQLVTKDDGTIKQFKPQIFQSRRRGTNVIMIEKIIRISIAEIVEIGEFNLVVEINMDRIIEVDQGMDKVIGIVLGEEILEVMQEHIKVQILGDRTIEEDIEEMIGMRIMTEKEIGVGLEKDHIQTTVEGETRVVVIVYQGQDQGWVQIGIGNIVHFSKDFPTTREEREIEQIQQMFNLDEEQMSFRTLATNDAYDNFSLTSSLEEVSSKHLNL